MQNVLRQNIWIKAPDTGCNTNSRQKDKKYEFTKIFWQDGEKKGLHFSPIVMKLLSSECFQRLHPILQSRDGEFQVLIDDLKVSRPVPDVF